MGAKKADFTNETIAAQATPPGRGGVGIIRISGSQVSQISKKILGQPHLNPSKGRLQGSPLQARYAHFTNFLDSDGQTIDEGLALYFPNPNSFTGEDVLELQGHGGPVVMDRLLQRVLQLGARLAKPGEFSERAFLNGKLDLTQTEAIADLINASSQQASKSAIRSLQGKFSQQINSLAESLIDLRMHVESSIDFAEEEIEELSAEKISKKLVKISKELVKIQQKTQQGVLLQEGIKVVIAGEPNVGKSSLLNLICGQDSAIVTDIPGTTRDVLREYINIDGLPLHIIDTAGLRDSNDIIEQEGIKRAWNEIENADFVLLVTDKDDIDLSLFRRGAVPTIIIRNKIDLIGESEGLVSNPPVDTVRMSAKTGVGLDLLQQQLKKRANFTNFGEGIFIARRRHLQALEQAQQQLTNAQQQLQNKFEAELLAEDLRQAHKHLGEITGEFYTEDLLDRIFSEFCIGK